MSAKNLIYILGLQNIFIDAFLFRRWTKSSFLGQFKSDLAGPVMDVSGQSVLTGLIIFLNPAGLLIVTSKALLW